MTGAAVNPWEHRRPPAGQVVLWRTYPSGPADLAVLRRALSSVLASGDAADRVGPVGPVGPAATPDDHHAVLLILEELGSNALRHGRPPVEVSVESTGVGWLLSVRDAAADAPPVPTPGRRAGHGGVGLHLVADLAVDHGWTAGPGHKIVWAYRIPFLRADALPARVAAGP